MMSQDTEKLFYSAANPKELRVKNLWGLSVEKPSFNNYTVFIQSTELGKRHLGHESRILYEV